jgi:DNA processing protein
MHRIEDPAELEAWLTWLRAPGIGDRELRALVMREGGASPALRTARAAPAALGLSARTQAALRQPDTALLARERAWLARPGHALVTFDGPDYPPLLGQSPHAPAALFVLGRVELLALPALAIVGSRNATPTGLAHARRLRAHAVRLGPGHRERTGAGRGRGGTRAALACGGRTIAVCGTGLTWSIRNATVRSPSASRTRARSFPSFRSARRRARPTSRVATASSPRSRSARSWSKPACARAP